jgi:hypothetical protein
MLGSILEESGHRVGRYLSPHVHTVEERIAVNGKPISPEAFVAAFEAVIPKVQVIDRAAARLSADDASGVSAARPAATRNAATRISDATRHAATQAAGAMSRARALRAHGSSGGYWRSRRPRRESAASAYAERRQQVCRRLARRALGLMWQVVEP